MGQECSLSPSTETLDLQLSQHTVQLKQLQLQAMADVPAHHLLITKFGDMNARLEKESDDDPRWYFHSHTNRNGNLLIDTALECDMEITNFRFRKKKNKL